MSTVSCVRPTVRNFDFGIRVKPKFLTVLTSFSALKTLGQRNPSELGGRIESKSFLGFLWFGSPVLESKFLVLRVS